MGLLFGTTTTGSSLVHFRKKLRTFTSYYTYFPPALSELTSDQASSRAGEPKTIGAVCPAVRSTFLKRPTSLCMQTCTCPCACACACIPVPYAFLYNSSTSSVSLLACTSLTSSSARSSDRRRDLRRGATSRAGLCCRTARTGGVGPLEETRARRVEAGERDDRDDLSVT